MSQASSDYTVMRPVMIRKDDSILGHSSHQQSNQYSPNAQKSIFQKNEIKLLLFPLSLICLLMVFGLESTQFFMMMAVLVTMNGMGFAYGSTFVKVVTTFTSVFESFIMNKYKGFPFQLILAIIGLSFAVSILLKRYMGEKPSFLSSGIPSALQTNILANREWISLIVHQILKHSLQKSVSVTNFDIGGTLPSIRTREKSTQLTSLSSQTPRQTSSSNLQDDGFSSIIDFEYFSNSDTKIEVKIPMSFPVVGEINVPLIVTSPQISVAVEIEFLRTLARVPNSSSTDPQPVLAIAYRFEPIKVLHIGEISISYASYIHLVQYMPFIKNQIHSNVNTALNPERRTVLVFDAAWKSFGSFELDRNEKWSVKSLLEKSTNQQK